MQCFPGSQLQVGAGEGEGTAGEGTAGKGDGIASGVTEMWV